MIAKNALPLLTTILLLGAALGCAVRAHSIHSISALTYGKGRSLQAGV